MTLKIQIEIWTFFVVTFSDLVVGGGSGVGYHAPGQAGFESDGGRLPSVQRSVQLQVLRHFLAGHARVEFLRSFQPFENVFRSLILGKITSLNSQP